MAQKSSYLCNIRRIQKKLPSGRWKIFKIQRRPSKAVCATTGVILSGVPQARNIEMTRIDKSKRRPNRPYGGVLSSKAMRELMIEKARREI